MYKHIKHSGRWLISHKDWKANLVFMLGGLAVGLVAVLMAVSSEWANHTFFNMVEKNEYIPFLVSPLGFILIVYLTRKYFPGAEGSGIPQVVATLELGHEKERSILLTIRIATGKVLLCIMGLLSGASIGREGPTVHVGAAIMFSLRRFVRFRLYDMDRVLIIAGGAAGVSAAFNTPLAGIVFAIEELSRSFEVRTRGLMLAAVMMAAITAIAILDNYSYFGEINAVINVKDAVVPVLVCGIVCGVFGGVFSLMLIQGSRWVAPYRSRNPYVVAGLCGLGIAIIGFYSGHLTYGSGYEQAKAIVENTGEIGTDYGYLKLLATVVSYLSGIPGGIFAPSLSAGAGIGAHLAQWLVDYPYGVIVLFAMVGYFSGVVQAPITAFVIVLEMTNQHELVLPLMITAFLAAGVSKSICKNPIYSTLADNFLPDDKKIHGKKN
ncbi:Chloride channel protein [hydrothermal vent metagenome]|uniref:Chloride channel protein n=1 Tax=hydrothermal vent metagenome TaxID=652676 RepID=A0A3B0XP52_9ZZZZ